MLSCAGAVDGRVRVLLALWFLAGASGPACVREGDVVLLGDDAQDLGSTSNDAAAGTDPSGGAEEPDMDVADVPVDEAGGPDIFDRACLSAGPAPVDTWMIPYGPMSGSTWGTAVCEASNGDVVIAGTGRVLALPPEEAGLWVARIDPATGGFVWQRRTRELGSLVYEVMGIVARPEGGFVVGVSVDSIDGAAPWYGWFLALDEDGDLEWQWAVAGLPSGFGPTPDGDYLDCAA